MPLKSFRCPDCKEGPMDLCAGDHDGLDTVQQVHLVCNSGPGNSGCGTGWVILTTGDIPVHCIKNIAEIFLPEEGIPIKVEKKLGENGICSFDYRGENYGQCKTVFSCSILDNNDSSYQITWFLLEFPGGEALLQYREHLLGVDEGVWLLTDISKSTIVTGERLGTKLLPIIATKNATGAYHACFQSETLIRNLIAKICPNDELEKILKDTTYRRGDNKSESLFEMASGRKQEEQEMGFADKDTPLIEYIDWSDYITIFRKQGDALFKNVKNKDKVMKLFISRIEEAKYARHKIAHMRNNITKEDIDSLDRMKKTVAELLES
ncbi:MAG: hypothetical protein AAB038_05425 [Planctomycetota bacterium]